MAALLSIETATHVCSVAIHVDHDLVAYAESHLGQSHSKKLLPMIDQVLANADLNQHDLDSIAVAEGPGSYTGLRIGLATAKGLCYANDIPLIGISTLMAMAAGQKRHLPKGALLAPLIDARRMEAYGLVVDTRLKIIEDQRPFIFDEDSFQDYLSSASVYFFGNGSDKLMKLIKHENASFITGVYPSAKYIGELAFDRLIDNKFEDLAYFKPNYLKEFYTPKPPSQ